MYVQNSPKQITVSYVLNYSHIHTVGKVLKVQNTILRNFHLFSSPGIGSEKGRKLWVGKPIKNP